MPQRRTNRLLSLLSDDDYEHLRPHLSLITLEYRKILYEAARPIEHVRFPFQDGSAPRDLHSVRALVADLDGRINGGAKIDLHCLAGLGRTGTIAACLLILRGRTFHEAVRAVRTARSQHAIETAVQEAFVRTFASEARHW